MIGPCGARAQPGFDDLGNRQHPPANVGQLVLDRVGHATAHLTLEGTDAAQIADLAPQRRLSGAADAFAQVGQTQRALEVGTQDRGR